MRNDTMKIALCDDDPIQQQAINALLNKFSFHLQIENFEDADHFLDQFFGGKYDLILMDIYMSGTSGVEAAARIRQEDPDVPIAFITTSPDHALDGYRCHVNRYLLKPVKEDDMQELLQYALREKRLQPGINVHIGGRDLSVPFNQIRYIEQSGRSVLLHMTDGETEETTGKLDDMETIVSQPPFLRCHKSFLVNLNYVQSLDTELNVFEMKGGGNVYIRRSSVSKASGAYRSFMFEKARRHS